MTDTLEYDATGLLCPLPVLRANRMLRELASGGLLTVRATDPATEQSLGEAAVATVADVEEAIASAARGLASAYEWGTLCSELRTKSKVSFDKALKGK